MEEDEGHTQFKEGHAFSAKGIPICPSIERDQEPDWLLANSDLKDCPPFVEYESISMHILDQGYGASTCITFREIDDESEYRNAMSSLFDSKLKEEPLEYISRMGVLGRMIYGFRRKLFDVICNDGNAIIAGSLDDCPASLALMLESMIHSYSMNTLGALDHWINLVEKEVKDIAVSKHQEHVKELKRILQSFRCYIQPINDCFEGLRKEAIEASEKAAAAAEEEGSVDIRMVDSSHLPKRKGSVLMLALDAKVTRSTAILSDTADSLPITFELIEPFLGDNPVSYIDMVLEGSEDLEIKVFGLNLHIFVCLYYTHI